MYIITPLDIVALFILGYFSGYLYRNYLYVRSPDWNIRLTWTVIPLYLAWVVVYNAVFTASTTGFYELSMPLAAVFIASYYFWYRAGARIYYTLFGKHPRQEGVAWVVKIND